MYGVEIMKYAISAFGLFSGLMLSTSGVYAQEAGKKDRQHAESEVQNPVEIGDTREKLLRDAEALMKAGKPDDAYILLEPFEFDRSGEVRFDYLIGIAALDSGKPDKATLAFERVLAEDPEYAGARLDMARAYYQLGDMSRAKTEFETVLNQYPSDAARATIQKYLGDIAGQEAGKQTLISAYVEGTFGRDTNVNNGSEIKDNILTPTLSPTIVELADNYYGVAAGGEIIHSLNANWRLYAGADLSQRNNLRQKLFDTRSLDERVGVIYGTRADRYRLGVLGGQNTQGDRRYRNNAGVNVEWRHAVGANNQLNVFGQTVRYRYADVAMKLNDVNQQVAGVGWLHVLRDAKSTLSGSLYFGTENDVGPSTVYNLNGGRTDGIKRFGGLRVGGQAVFGESAELFFSAGVQEGKFDNVNPLISGRRNDHLDDFALGVKWFLDNLWTMRAQLVRLNTMSNVAVYSYDRTDYSLTLRRNF